MPLCNDCDTLVGKLTMSLPHGSLCTNARHTRPYGVIEHFTCDTCGTVLERFRATPAWCHAPHVWNVRTPAWAV